MDGQFAQLSASLRGAAEERPRGPSEPPSAAAAAVSLPPESVPVKSEDDEDVRRLNGSAFSGTKEPAGLVSDSFIREAR